MIWKKTSLDNITRQYPQTQVPLHIHHLWCWNSWPGRLQVQPSQHNSVQVQNTTTGKRTQTKNLIRFVDSESRNVARTLQEMEDFSPIGSSILNKSGVIAFGTNKYRLKNVFVFFHLKYLKKSNTSHTSCSWFKRSLQCSSTQFTSSLVVSRQPVLMGPNSG